MKSVFKIKKGLDVKLIGDADFIIKAHKVSKVAVCPDDFKWLKAKLNVNERDNVKIGTPIIFSKDNPEIKIVAPISGEVTSIVRGEKRKIERIVITSDNKFEKEDFNLDFKLERTAIINAMLTTGLWPFIKQRPFDCIADPNDIPKAIFISCFDSSPLAPSYSFLLQDRQEEFQKGIEILSHLTNGPIILGLKNNIGNSFFEATKNVQFKYFEGPHPSGNIGTQIHYISPLAKGEIVWYVNPQDIAIIGKLYLKNELDFSKIIVLCGSGIAEPYYLKTISGSNILDAIMKMSNIECAYVNDKCIHPESECSNCQIKGTNLVSGRMQLGKLRIKNYGFVIEDKRNKRKKKFKDVDDNTVYISSNSGPTDARIISGNVLTGTNISKSTFLRFYHNQVTVIPEGGKRRFLGWLYPGFRLWSVSHTYVSWLYPNRKHNLDTTLHGGKRAMILSDIYEKVFPLDILPMELLKACVIGDTELMEQLGIYEVVEEDFALCEVVCPSKTECQKIIYDGLSLLKE
ncbi:MAG: NADH:ubiquinone reductase (Na(+)-transporting) subunit A [Bacteroidales bacterium]|jgi:Na+-transporting NADH:ubiquinone oxidoreductase subunit A|nr:NADH:ubiquinone reductase (Na(+)-transporting) subunit A [Bacteroidales bacterium]